LWLYLLPGSTKAAFELLSKIGVTMLESIVVDELLEFHGREKLANTTVKVTSLVKTRPYADDIPRCPFSSC